ncbi:unnamed protein product [Protopolystoma xenopodis]|uniref:Fibronectin type-III domain-containing protein n=1 Tax=Protopolystoma xenopodis TaxID=117903 RepID=A0A3S5A8S1_9PLAT|nr:unnamed protein product [Protopolystoma xenopodis]
MIPNFPLSTPVIKLLAKFLPAIHLFWKPVNSLQRFPNALAAAIQLGNVQFSLEFRERIPREYESKLFHKRSLIAMDQKQILQMHQSFRSVSADKISPDLYSTSNRVRRFLRADPQGWSRPYQLNEETYKQDIVIWDEEILSPGKEYSFRICRRDSKGARQILSPWSDSVDFLHLLPVKPEILSIKPRSPKRLHILWSYSPTEFLERHLENNTQIEEQVSFTIVFLQLPKYWQKYRPDNASSADTSTAFPMTLPSFVRIPLLVDAILAEQQNSESFNHLVESGASLISNIPGLWQLPIRVDHGRKEVTVQGLLPDKIYAFSIYASHSRMSEPAPALATLLRDTSYSLLSDVKVASLDEEHVVVEQMEQQSTRVSGPQETTPD